MSEISGLRCEELRSILENLGSLDQLDCVCFQAGCSQTILLESGNTSWISLSCRGSASDSTHDGIILHLPSVGFVGLLHAFGVAAAYTAKAKPKSTPK